MSHVRHCVVVVSQRGCWISGEREPKPGGRRMVKYGEASWQSASTPPRDISCMVTSYLGPSLTVGMVCHREAVPTLCWLTLSELLRLLTAEVNWDAVETGGGEEPSYPIWGVVAYCGVQRRGCGGEEQTQCLEGRCALGARNICMWGLPSTLKNRIYRGTAQLCWCVHLLQAGSPADAVH